MPSPVKTLVTNMRPETGRPQLMSCQLGHVPYQEALNLQKRLQQRLIEAKRRTIPEVHPNILLLLEHPPTYTLGKSGRKENLLLSERELENIGASFFPIGRGGDITYHGPGQLVGYPILDLHAFRPDLTRYVRTLEEMVIRLCSDFGIAAHRSEAGTGVWIGTNNDERKVCAIGIRCSRWVSMHGFALNMNTDLSFFEHIVPCGIVDRGVTTLAEELGASVDEAEVQDRLIDHFDDLFGTSTKRLSLQAAWDYVDTFAADVS